MKTVWINGFALGKSRSLSFSSILKNVPLRFAGAETIEDYQEVVRTDIVAGFLHLRQSQEVKDEVVKSMCYDDGGNYTTRMGTMCCDVMCDMSNTLKLNTIPDTTAVEFTCGRGDLFFQVCL
jgi:hypothetical protein